MLSAERHLRLLLSNSDTIQIRHRFSPPTRCHAEHSEASAIALVTTQTQSKSATNPPRQSAVMLSAAKHLRLLLSRLRRNPNPSQILLAKRCHAERREASAVALVTTQTQSKSATDSPRQRAVMLSAAKHLRLLLSQLRRNPNPPQIPRQRAVMLSTAKHLRSLLSQRRFIERCNMPGPRAKPGAPAQRIY